MAGTSDFGALNAQVEQAMEALGIPGVAVGIIHGGREHTAGFGVTNVNHPLPVDADTLFQIGSITKTFVGTLAMRLADEGRLDMDRPLREYLPELRLKDRVATEQVTMRHLLSHTGGWVGDYFDDTGMGDDALERIVRRMADLDQLTPFGSLFHYSNSSFYLAGRAIEIITGQPFEEAMRELVLEPLGMTMSFFHPGDVMVHRFAVGHNVASDGATVATPWPLARAANAAGGIASTVNDMLKYARFQITGMADDGTRVLSEAALAEMRRPHAPVDTFGNHVGITWMLRNLEGTRVYTHSGGTNGQISVFIVVPEQQFALVILTNANRGGELTNQVSRWAIREYLGTREPEVEHQSLSAEELQTFAGHYTGQLTDIALYVESGDLMLQAIPRGGFPKKDSPAGPKPPPVRAAFIGADQVLLLDPPFKDTRGEFIRDDRGEIVWFRMGSRIARRN